MPARVEDVLVTYVQDFMLGSISATGCLNSSSVVLAEPYKSMHWTTKESTTMARVHNLQELFLSAAAQHPDRTAFRHIKGMRARELAYKHLARMTYEGAQSLWLRGVRRGHRVGLFAENSPDWVLAAISVFRLGGVLVPIDAVWDPDQVAKLADQFDIKLLIAGSRQYTRLAERLPASKLVLIDEHSWLRAPDGAGDSRVAQLHPAQASDAAVVAFTAGVAGRSKPVVLTHENLTSTILACAKALPFDRGDEVVSTLPLSNMLGFTVGLAVPFLKGATMVFSKADSATEIKGMMGTAGPTVLVGQAPIFQSMLAELESEAARLPRAARLALGACRQAAMAVKRATVYSHEHRSIAWLAGKVVSVGSRFSPQLSTIRRFSCVASRLSRLPAHLNRELLDSLESFGDPIKCWISCDQPASPELVAAVESFGIPFINVYGITEASGPVSVRPPFEPWCDAFPQQLEGVDIRVESTTIGGVGEILIRSPGVAQFYCTTDGSPSPVTVDGWLHTGDVGLFDPDNGLFLRGNQAEQLLTRSGTGLDPLRLEKALTACPAVYEACVFVRVGKSGRELCAAVVSSPLLRSVPNRHEFIARELAEALESLPESERLSEFQVWDEPLPRTGTGKLRR
ncbi:MAG TPA: class I adenylate-forming enzyme family protein, partial [Candidatus Obscuribacterales bacterium]